MSIIKQALYSSGSSIFIWSYARHSVCRVWALMHLKQCEVNEDWRSCPASLFVFFDCGFYSNHHNNSFNNQMCCIGMAAIRQVQNDALLNLQQRVRWMCLFITDHAQHQLLQRLICHLYSPRWTTVGCFCLWFFFSFFFALCKNDNARDQGCLSPHWTVICAPCL